MNDRRCGKHAGSGTLYRIDDAKKTDPELRWALPDRVFFACGACHILAYAFMESHADLPLRAVWVKPEVGFAGNHIYVASGDWVFDYHGYCDRERFLRHMRTKSQRWWPGWSATEVELPRRVLICERESRTYAGLWLREPGQFLHDALPRAYGYLKRFPSPSARPGLSRS